MTTCPLCTTDLGTAETVNTIARHGHQQTSVVCPTCALVQESPLPTAETLAAYYRDEYRHEFSDLPAEGHEPWSPEWVATMRTGSLDYLRSVVLPTIGEGFAPKTALEVGAGHGFMCEALVEGGVAVSAIEPGAQCRERLLSLPGVTLLDAATPHEATGSYDLVIALHVLEHDRDPVAFVRRCMELVAPGGFLWVEVPDVMRPYGALSHFFQRPHVFNFSVHSLAITMLMGGAASTCKVGPAAFAKVLLGWAQRTGDVVPMAYEDARAQIGKTLQGGVAEEVAQHLQEYEWRRTKSAGALLAKWMAGESVESLGGERFEAFLRHQFRDMDTSAIAMRRDLQAWTKQVEGWVNGRASAWEPTEWGQGYLAGAAVMAQACQVRVTHLLNQDVMRGIGRE